MKTASRRDYLRRIHAPYRAASWAEKRRILDEFCANCGCHRKYAIRVLNGAPPEVKPKGSGRRRRRGATVRAAGDELRVIEAVVTGQAAHERDSNTIRRRHGKNAASAPPTVSSLPSASLFRLTGVI